MRTAAYPAPYGGFFCGVDVTPKEGVLFIQARAIWSHYLKSMNKFFLSIATSAICLTGMATQVQAAPAWANQAAKESCRFMRQGYSPRRAGEKAAIVVLSGRNGQAMMNTSSSEVKALLMPALVAACPSTLIEASQRSSI